MSVLRITQYFAVVRRAELTKKLRSQFCSDIGFDDEEVHASCLAVHGLCLGALPGFPLLRLGSAWPLPPQVQKVSLL